MILEFTVLVPKKKNGPVSVDEDQKPKTIEDYEKKKAWFWIDPKSPPAFGAYHDDSGVGTFFDLCPTGSGRGGIHLPVDPLTALSALERAIYDAKSARAGGDAGAARTVPGRVPPGRTLDPTQAGRDPG